MWLSTWQVRVDKLNKYYAVLQTKQKQTDIYFNKIRKFISQIEETRKGIKTLDRLNSIRGYKIKVYRKQDILSYICSNYILLRLFCYWSIENSRLTVLLLHLTIPTSKTMRKFKISKGIVCDHSYVYFYIKSTWLPCWFNRKMLFIFHEREVRCILLTDRGSRGPKSNAVMRKYSQETITTCTSSSSSASSHLLPPFFLMFSRKKCRQDLSSRCATNN